jgi:hypothetical protein
LLELTLKFTINFNTQMIYKKFKNYQRLYKKYWFSYQNKKINLKISWDSTFKMGQCIHTAPVRVWTKVVYARIEHSKEESIWRFVNFNVYIFDFSWNTYCMISSHSTAVNQGLIVKSFLANAIFFYLRGCSFMYVSTRFF